MIGQILLGRNLRQMMEERQKARKALEGPRVRSEIQRYFDSDFSHINFAVRAGNSNEVNTCQLFLTSYGKAKRTVSGLWLHFHPPLRGGPCSLQRGGIEGSSSTSTTPRSQLARAWEESGIESKVVVIESEEVALSQSLARSRRSVSS